jgi:hypothetical protein
VTFEPDSPRQRDADGQTKHNPSVSPYRRPREEGSVKAYVLIQIEPGAQAPDGSLLAISEIVDAERLSGPYDAIALADTDGARQIDAVLEEVRLLPGVLRAIAAPLVRSGDRPVLAGAATGTGVSGTEAA